MSSPADPLDAIVDARADALRAALVAHGIVASVQADGSLARLHVTPAAGDLADLFDAATRAAVARLARLEGFTHVAVEL